MSLPPLPPLISVVSEVVKDALASENKNVPLIPSCQTYKKLIIIYSRSISDADMFLIQRFGKVIPFNDSLLNLDLNTIDCDYITVDASNSKYLTNVENHISDPNFAFVHYGYSVEDGSFPDIVSFTSFKIASNKINFDRQMMNKRVLKKRSLLISCAGFLVNALAQLKK